MRNTKLIQLLQFLSAWEIRRFNQFVQSPFFNRDEKLVALAELLADVHPSFEEKQINKSIIYQLIFPDQPFSEQRFYDLTSQLTQLLETFLATCNFMESSNSLSNHLLSEMREKGMDKWFEKAYKKKIKQKPTHFATNDHQYHLKLEESYLQFTSNKKQRKSDRRVQEIVFHLDRWYLIQRLRYSCGMINRRELLGDEIDLEILNDLSGYFQTHLSEFENSPELIGYYRIFEMLNHPDEASYFTTAWEYIRSSHSILPINRQQEMYGYMMNYCIQRLNKGDRYFQEVLFDMYTWQLSLDLLLQNGWLSPWDFKNIVSLALKMEKYEWTQAFIEKHKISIAPEHRENAVTYNLATLHFSQRNFSKTLKLLQGITFDDVFYEIGAKTLLLKIYYESEDFETLFYLLDAFEAYLRRNRMRSTYQKELYLNLIRFTRKLTRLIIKTNTTYQLAGIKQLQAFQNKLAKASNTAQKDWLEKNLEEILRKSKTNESKN